MIWVIVFERREAYGFNTRTGKRINDCQTPVLAVNAWVEQVFAPIAITSRNQALYTIAMSEL